MTGVTPMNSDSRPAIIRRLSMSRPSSSEPSGKPGVPTGRRRRSMAPRYGSMGVIQGDRIATATMNRMRAAATIATGSRTSLCPTLPQ